MLTYAGAAFDFRGENFTFDGGTSLFRFTGANSYIYHYSSFGGGLGFHNVIFEAVTGTGTANNAGGSFNEVIFNSNGTINGGEVVVNLLTIAGSGTINSNGNVIQTAYFGGNGTLTGNSTFGTLEFTPGNTYTLTAGRIQTINDAFLANGTCAEPITIKSSSTTATTIEKTAGTVTVTHCYIEGVTASGGANFIAENSVNGGNNSGWTFIESVQNLYWVGGTGNWNDITHWASESGGAGGYCLPTQLDNVIFDDNSFIQTGQAVYVDVADAMCNNMDWSAVTFDPTFTSLSNTYPLTIFGSLVLSPDMNFAFSGPVWFAGETPEKSGYEIKMAGNNFNNAVYFSGDGGIWTLMDNFTIPSNDLYLNFGTLNTNGMEVNVRRFISDNNNLRSLTLGSSLFSITSNLTLAWYVTGNNFTIDPGTSEIRFTTANGSLYSQGGSLLAYNNVVFQNPGGTSNLQSDDQFNHITFQPAGKLLGNGSFNTVIFTGDGEINQNNTFGDVTFMNNATIKGGNTFNNLIFTPGKLCQMEAGQTQTILNDLTFWGNADNPITLQSITSGSQATISKTDGTVSGNYILLKDMVATGGATFNVYNSTNNGNNAGWNFLEPPFATCPDNFAVCENVNPFVLDMADPSGWDYSGEGVYFDPIGEMYMFDPSLVPVGPVTITYTIGGLFPGSCEFIITVLPLPVAECIPDIEVCEDTDYIFLYEGIGQYYYDGEPISGFDPVDPGTFPIIFEVTNSCGVATCTFNIIVDPAPEVSISGDLEFCEGQSTVLTASEGVSYLWSTGETTRSITVTVAGNYSVVVTNEFDCEGTAEVTTSYLEITIPTCPDNMNVYVTDPPFALTGGLPVGGTYSGTGVTNNIFDPSIGVGNYLITYMIDDVCGPQSCEFSIIVEDEPVTCEDAVILDFPQSISDRCYDPVGYYSYNFIAVTVLNAIEEIWTVTPPDAGTFSGREFYLDPYYIGGITITLTAIAEDPCLDAEASVGFTVFPLPTYSYELSDTDICSGEIVVYTNYFTGTAPWTVEFYSNGELMSFTTFDNPQTYTETFTETTTYEPYLVTDGNGCSTELNQPATITVFPLPTYSYELSDTDICSGEIVVYTNYFTGTAPWTVEFYSNGELMSFTTFDNPQTYTETFTETTTYEPYLVTDGNGCSSAIDQPATIIVHPLPTLTTEYSATEVCYGETVEFTNYFTGIAPWTVEYEYNGIPGSFTTSDNPDYYSEVFYETTINEIISVTDGNGCTTNYDNNITTITVYPLPVIEITGELQFCEGQSTVLTATEGVSYDWSTGESTQSITVTLAGLYSVVVIDANGCEGYAEVTTSYLPVTIPTCPDDMYVIVTDPPFILTGGLPEGGTYSGTGVTGGFFDPSVGVGNYPITYQIEDICGPQSCEFLIIVSDEPITCEDAVISNFPASVSNVCEGEPYSIDFSTVIVENAIEEIWNVEPTTAGGVVSDIFTLVPGYVGGITITLTAIAEEPCQDAQEMLTFDVYPLPTFMHEISATEVCSGEEVTITDYFTGSAPWQVTIEENGEPFTFTVPESPAIRVMTLTETLTYEVVSVTDNNGCTVQVNEEVSIIVHPLPGFTYEVSDSEICYGEEVTFINYFSGTAPWTVLYMYNGITDTFTTSDNPEYFITTFTETITYEPITVTDGNGCSSAIDQPATIIVHPLPTLTTEYSATEVCYGETVEFTNYFTGIAPWTVEYEYNGIPGSFTTSDNPDYYSEVFYETTINEIISVTDGNGCTTNYDNNITTITVYPLPVIEITGELQFCEGQSTVLTATEGVSYDWSTGESTQSITVTLAGLYSVVVIDANGCEGYAEVTTSYLPVTIPTCPDDMYVIVTDPPFILTGGLPEGGTYSGTGVTGGFFDPSVGVGNYPITYQIEDICGPQSCEFLIIVSDEPITCEDAVISNFPASVSNVCEGEPYSIDFSTVIVENAIEEIWNVEPTTAGGVVSDIFTLVPGYVGGITITLTAIAEEPCQDAQEMLTFDVYPLPTFMHEISATEVCSGEEVTITDYFTGSAPWQVTIEENGEPFTFTVPESPAIRVMTLTETLTYEVISVTDNNGCFLEVNELVNIIVNPLPTFSYELSSTELCFGEELIWTEYFTGTPPWTVEFLYNGEPDSFIAYNNPEIFTEIVTASFTFEPLTVTDGNGCTAIVNQPVAVTVNPLPTFEFEVSETEICAGEPVVFTNYFTGQAPWTVAYSYNGVPGSFTTAENPEFFTAYFNETTTYITQLVTDGNGCSTELNQEVTITVTPAPEVFCPADLEVFDIDPPVLLNQASPAAGTYSGTGVFVDGDNFYFDPSTGTGVYEIVYCIVDEITGCSGCCSFIIEVIPVPGDEQIICMPEGWSLISSYYIPENPQLEYIFDDLSQQNKLIIMLGKGGIFWPGQNVNTLGGWDVYNAYKIKLSESGCIEINGEMPENKTILLTPGSNLVPVLCDQPVPSATIFDQLTGKILFVYDLQDNLLYWPQGGIYEIEYLEPGKGYLFSMLDGAEIVFNCAKNGIESYTPAKLQTFENAPWNIVRTETTHFVSISKEASLSLESGDFIGVFNSMGQCAGITRFENNNTNTLLVAYGDDFTTEEEDGFTVDEPMSFRVFRNSLMKEMTLDVIYDVAMPNAGYFAVNGLSSIAELKTGTTTVSDYLFGFITIHPNPGKDFINVTIPAFNGAILIDISSMEGQNLFLEKYDGQQSEQIIKIDLTSAQPGVYLARFILDGHTVVKKIVLQ
ncbi:MAG TPA: T9SS type A sorting domain-containing protein [Bacteroidales bacterium]|nr:T9SS type A sorting domain-containing protein [Bacteroidales bacterium]